jgi:hypothetical protein
MLVRILFILVLLAVWLFSAMTFIRPEHYIQLSKWWYGLFDSEPPRLPGADNPIVLRIGGLGVWAITSFILFKIASHTLR